jgi:DNA-binding response OmpR family regulator
MKIICLCSNEIISQRISTFLNQQADIIPFNRNIDDYTVFDAAILVEPFECKGEHEDPEKGGLFVSSFVLWKRYMELHAPDIKLMMSGFQSINHPNYISLLELSEDYPIKDKILDAHSVTVSYEKDLPYEGEQVAKRLKIFFEGHNHEGMIKTLASIRQSLNHAYNRATPRDIEAFHVIWEEDLYPERQQSKLLNSRWKNYCPYFESMPFYHKLDAVKAHHFIEQLQLLYEGTPKLKSSNATKKLNLFNQLNAYNRLDELQTILDQINKQYVSPETVGKALLIDDDVSFFKKIKNAFPTIHFIWATNEQEAFHHMKSSQPDFILLDLQLSPLSKELSGLNVLTRIKEKYPDQTIIISSTHEKKIVFKESLKRGATSFLKKSEYDRKDWGRMFLEAIAGRLRQARLSDFTESVVPKKADILVIEDEDDWYDTIFKGLARKDYCLTRALTPQAARDELQESPDKYDLIILDLYFEEDNKLQKTGLDLIEEIFGIAIDTPIIVITQDIKNHTAKTALEKGAIDYFRKDRFEPVVWMKRFDNYIELSKLRKLKNEKL